MPLRDSVKALSDFIRKSAQAARADVSLERALSGDAGDMHYLMSAEFHDGPFAGRHALVVQGQRDDGGSGLGSVQAFAVRRVAFGAGLTTPEALWLEPTGHVLGRPFTISRHAAGTVDAVELQRDLSEEEGDRLAFRLGQELARLHRVTLDTAPAELAFLPRPGADWARQRVATWRAALDGVATPQPCFEWAINWFADHAPGVERFALCHGGVRLGNLVADRAQLIGILDLGQVRWSDPMEDLGWLCARGARHGLPAREAGGIGSREALYDGYRDVAGQDIDDRRVRFWEIAAAIRQGIAALQRGGATGDAEQGLAAMLTGMQSIETEYDILLETELYAAEAA